MARGQRNLRVMCPLGELLSATQLQVLMEESRQNERWAAIEQALSAQAGVTKILPSVTVRIEPASSIPEFSLGDCGGEGENVRTLSSRNDRAARAARSRSEPGAMSSLGECCGPSDVMRQLATPVAPIASSMGGDCDPPMMATVTVTASPAYGFLSHDTIICLVFGKCASEWGANDPWWGESELWVHYDGMGGGGLYGAGSSPPPPPPVDATTPVAADTIPDCSNPNNDDGRKAWCSPASWTPGQAESAQIDSAVTRMRAKGGACTQLASIIESLLLKGRIRIYASGSWPFGGKAPLVTDGTGANHWMVLAGDWFTVFNSPANATVKEPVRRWLDQTLAHEADHLSGLNHIDPPAGYSTPNSSACS